MSSLITILFIVLTLASHTTSAGESAALKWYTLEEALELASQSNKKILIDVYTDWCGWCKKMDSQTFGDKGVSSYLSKHFVPVKLNAESAKTLSYKGKVYTQRELSGAFGITGYPSVIFLASNGDPITVYPGFADAARFKNVLAYIATDSFRTSTFEEYMKSKK